MMEKDISIKILKDFGKEADNAIRLLTDFQEKSGLSPRVMRSIIHLANGNPGKLQELITSAEEDWRDVIVLAETTVFEFNKPFKET
jgi:hypothetical protein